MNYWKTVILLTLGAVITLSTPSVDPWTSGWTWFLDTFNNCCLSNTDYHRCQKALDAKGVDTAPCDWYKRVYKSLCPISWVKKKVCFFFLAWDKTQLCECALTGVRQLLPFHAFFESPHNSTWMLKTSPLKRFHLRKTLCGFTIFILVSLDSEMGWAERRWDVSRQNLTFFTAVHLQIYNLK